LILFHLDSLFVIFDVFDVVYSLIILFLLWSTLWNEYIFTFVRFMFFLFCISLLIIPLDSFKILICFKLKIVKFLDQIDKIFQLCAFTLRNISCLWVCPCPWSSYGKIRPTFFRFKTKCFDRTEHWFRITISYGNLTISILITIFFFNS